MSDDKINTSHRPALHRFRQFAAATWGRNAPLRLRLVLLVGIAMLPPGILAFWQAGYSYSSALRTLESNLEQAAQLAANEQERLVLATRDILISLAGQPAIRSGGESVCSRALRRAISALPQYKVAAVANESGRIVCSTGENKDVLDVSDRSWFRELQGGQEFVVSDQLLDRLTGERGIVAALRLNNESGAMTSAITAMIGVDEFTNSYRRLDLQRDATLAILNRDGEIIATTSQSAAKAFNLPPPAVRDPWLRSSSRTLTAKGSDGIRRVYATSSILGGRVVVVLGVPSSTVLNPLALQFAWGVFTPLLMWVLALVVVSYGIERLVVRWVTYLERVASAYAAGEREVRPDRLNDATAEIRHLGETFTHMADTISAHEAELRESLAQKDVLVREIHHRVKNNLQIVISLLNLHARRISSPQAEGAFTDVRGRINALATLHRRLYESEHLQHVDLKWFLEDICHEIRRGGLARGRNIKLTTRLPNETIGPDIAVPLGLLITEAVTNAYKHAFIGRSVGHIEVSGERDAENYLCIAVKDDGVGVKAGVENSTSAGLGQSLIEAFVRQLGGELTLESNAGTTLRVRFRHQAPTT